MKLGYPAYTLLLESISCQYYNAIANQLKIETIDNKQLTVTGSRKRGHFTDLLESRYRRLNNDNYNKKFFLPIYKSCL